MSQTEGVPEEDEKTKLALVEAALYAAGRPLELETLCSVTGITSKKRVYELARKVLDNYRGRDGALELLELSDRRFVLQIKTVYVPNIRRLSIKPLLTEGPLKTLSFIVLNQPVTQSDVALVRGGQVYEHVKHLAKMGLITSEPLGKTRLLRTTETFADYFNLSHDMKTLNKQFKALVEAISPESGPTAQK